MRALELETFELTKRFGAFTALDRVSLRVKPATVHALLGENGAGKSTLVKTVIGYQRPDAGQILINNKEVSIDTPTQARAIGIGMVFQHFTVIPGMTVAENLLLAKGELPAVIDWRAVNRELEEFVQSTPFKLALHRTPDSLSAGEKQKLEILKQLILNPRLLILDEPTSVLTPQEADEILFALNALAHEGRCSIIMITHKFKEVLAYADDVSVLRQGHLVDSMPVRSTSSTHLASLMVGESRKVFDLPQRMPFRGQRVQLQIKDLVVMGERGERAVDGLSLEVRAHEIVGVAGVAGNGQKALMQALTGQRPMHSGVVRVGGVAYQASRQDNEREGVRSLPEEPLQNACVKDFSVAQNMALRAFDQAPFSKFGFLRFGAMTKHAIKLIEQFHVKTQGPESAIGDLSGGNVQRAVLARELSDSAKLLLVSNPVFGLDFASVSEIHHRLLSARNSGTAVLLLSEDLDELLQMSDRILVMVQGKIVYEVDQVNAQRRVIGAYMGGEDASVETSEVKLGTHAPMSDEQGHAKVAPLQLGALSPSSNPHSISP